MIRENNGPFLDSLINLSWMHAQVFTNFKIHSINFSQKSTGRCPIVFGICLDLPKRFDLSMKLSNAIESRSDLLIVSNHRTPAS